ncbi:MAG TPA: prepilin-type N-terminal cleavage/methylation domain-containing protein [Planctomycetes bacterium]|nr:prepilin-type N-terminal cleavage/methylation domain-containing protein [Planctomycetota bacterium]HIJ70572.1 prepilin-type N-terminal cleavage/methylation domain-containing protein [Planctomycetota bacterium]
MTSTNDKICKNRAGFTYVELLVALMVCSVVFTAVASLSYALNSASNSTEQIGTHQMALRCATVRVSDLVKHSVMAFDTPGNGIALWTGDDNNDGLINGSELVYIGTDAGGQSLLLLDFPGQSQSVTRGEIESGTGKTDLVSVTDERYITLLPECDNVQITLDAAGTFVNILFDLTEAKVTSSYQISAVLRCSADNLLDPATGEPHGLGDDD